MKKKKNDKIEANEEVKEKKINKKQKKKERKHEQLFVARYIEKFILFECVWVIVVFGTVLLQTSVFPSIYGWLRSCESVKFFG